MKPIESDRSDRGVARLTYQTAEQGEMLATGSLKPFWRLHDPMCAGFLQLGCDPTHFLAVKAFFPFIREASVLHLPRTFDLMPSWLGLAFHAGFSFGANLPAETENIFEENGVERSEALRRLDLLRRKFGGHPATPINLHEVFQMICEEQWRRTPREQFLRVLTTASFNVFKAGLAAATIAQADPLLAEFVEPITLPLAAPSMALDWKVLMLSPRQAHGVPTWQILGHPLIRLARTYYWDTPRERDLIMPFFFERMIALGPLSENRCLVGDAQVVDWVRAGLEYGRQIKEQCPELLTEVLAEQGEDGLRTVRSAVERVLKKWGPEPPRLTGGIFEHHVKLRGWHGLTYYGELLDRLVTSADFAIWVSWV